MVSGVERYLFIFTQIGLPGPSKVTRNHSYLEFWLPSNQLLLLYFLYVQFNQEGMTCQKGPKVPGNGAKWTDAGMFHSVSLWGETILRTDEFLCQINDLKGNIKRTTCKAAVWLCNRSTYFFSTHFPERSREAVKGSLPYGGFS